MSKFTARPWRIHTGNMGKYLFGPTGGVLCSFPNEHTTDLRRIQAANIRLITAAPEMYEALQQIQSLRDRNESGEGSSDDEGEDVIGIVDDLLAKIDGPE